MSKRRTSEPVESSFSTALNKATDSLSLMDHPELLKSIFNFLGLDAYFDYYAEHGQQRRPAGEKFPIYHGQLHSFQVALNSYEGGLYSGLSTKELRILTTAALFHDACHTRGLHGDAVNIDNALRCFSRANDLAPLHQKLKADEYEEARALIKLTEFPYRIKKTTNTLARLLRDADMMGLYTTDADDLTELFTGLWNESHAGWGEKDTLSLFLEKQKKFISMLEWNTSWAKIKAFKRNWPQAGRRMALALQHAQSR